MISLEIRKFKKEKAESMMKQHNLGTCTYSTPIFFLFYLLTCIDLNLVHEMQVTQNRIVEVEAELDRVSRFRGDYVNSAVVHGKDQRFPKVSCT